MAAASLLSAAGLALALGSAPAGRRLAVTGFQEEDAPTRAIARSRTALTTVAVDGVNLAASGRALAAPRTAALHQLAVAHRDRLRAVLVVGNFDDAIGDFSEALAHRLLESPAAISAVAGALARTVAAEGWDGVNVDLESLRPRDAAGLTAFLTALRAALGAERSLSVDLMNGTTAAQFAESGYDLAAIGRTVDAVILMGYDQHGPWESRPGPIGALWWQRAGLAVLRRSVGPAKIDLGVAGYGYAWRPHSRPTLSDSEARALVASHHAHARYIKALGEWTARLGDGSTLWWSDARSYRQRLALARREHLHGLAIWSLGLADPLPAGTSCRSRHCLAVGGGGGARR